MNKLELARAVRDHAIEHYDDGGWDVLVECYDLDGIAEMIGRARTVKGALAKVKTMVGIYADREADAVISGGEIERADADLREIFGDFTYND